MDFKTHERIDKNGDIWLFSPLTQRWSKYGSIESWVTFALHMAAIMLVGAGLMWLAYNT